MNSGAQGEYAIGGTIYEGNLDLSGTYLYWQGTQGLENFDQNMLTLGWRWEI